jgi:hypothetical protein
MNADDDSGPHVIERQWADVRNWIAEVFGDRNPAALAVLDVGIEAGLDEYLGLTTSMHDLIFVARPAQSHDGAVIVRSPGSLRPARDGWIRIETANSWKKNTVIERPVNEAVGLFLRFIRETFGVTLRAQGETVKGPLARYRSDEAILAAIGREFKHQETVVEVRITKALADQAVAAWERDETETIPDETPAARQLRHRSGALALIGLAIQERGRVDGDGVVLELNSWQIGDALNAADESRPSIG